MKRKLLMATLTVTLALCSIIGLTACGHKHSYTESITAPTCLEQGYTTYTCSCGHSYVDDYVDELGHDFANYLYNDDATCTENGTETATCARENCNETHTRVKANSALSHDFGTPTYLWDEDTCIASRVCNRDNTHVETETVTGVYEKDTDATCTTNEKGHFQAIFTNSAFEVQQTATNSVEKANTKLGHNFVEYVYNNDATATENGTETATCERENCNETDTREKEDSATGFDTQLKMQLSSDGQYYIVKGIGEFSEDKLVILSKYKKLPVKEIANQAFMGCRNLVEVEIPESVTIIGDYAFDNCINITKIVMPDSVTSIGKGAFNGCRSLTRIEIPSGVTRISADAFKACSALTICCKMETQPEGWATNWNSSNCPVVWMTNGHMFIDYEYNNDATCTENGTETAVCDIEGCNETDTREKENSKLGHNFVEYVYNNDATETDNGTETATCERENCEETDTRERGNGVTETETLLEMQLSSDGQYYIVKGIGEFSEDKLVIPATYKNLPVKEIAGLAFIGCRNLVEVEIPESVTIIGIYAFDNCVNITKIVMPDSVTSIGEGAFNGCRSLTRIEISNNVTSIGKNAFKACSALTIYCEAESKPDGWSNSWNSLNCPVVWGYKG